MPDERLPTDFKRIIELLARHGVEYIVIGGQAEVLMGGARVTYDTDICYRRDPENIKRLAAVLIELNSKLRDSPRDLPFHIDARAIELRSNFTFDTDAGNFDVLAFVKPIGQFEQLQQNQETYDVGGITVHTISLEDLIEVKKHTCRRKDKDSLFQLIAIKGIRDEGKRQ